MSANTDAFLDAIAACEGTSGGDGYRALFGYTPTNGKTFENGYIWHPNVRASFVQTDGKINITTAAGRYQIIWPTWVRIAAKLNLKMFTPADQDAAALELISEAGAMGDVKDGNLQAAIDKCSAIWASLPSSKYPQPKRSLEFAMNAYTTAGGVLA